nr:efflux RND transporter periplasmic adaptor subunit [uncultured Roseateles sp.]
MMNFPTPAGHSSASELAPALPGARVLSRSLALLALAVGLSFGPLPDSQAQPMLSPADLARLNAAGPAAPMPIAETLCLIEPSQEVNVGTPVDGVLEGIYADRGDMVRVGQVLARLSSGVEQAAADLQAAKAEFGARKRARNEELHRKELISQHELDELSTELQIAELELKERQEQLKLRAVVSPINGVIVDRLRNRGDLVKQERIFRIAQIDPLHVEAVVPASRFGRIQVGQSYDVQLLLAGGRVRAQATQVDRVIDAASNTFRVRLKLANPNHLIPPGQRCQIQFGAPRS